MKMRNLTALAMGGVMVMSLAACGSSGGSTTAAPATTAAAATQAAETQAAAAPAAAEAPAAGDEVYVVRVGDTVQDDSPSAIVFNEVFIPYVEEHGKGKIVIERYGNSVLGSDQQLAESLQMGTLECACIPLSCMGNFDPDFMALDLPFLYDNAKTAYAALDGEWGQMFNEKMEAVGIKNIGWCENSFRCFSSNTPIRSVADMKGLKMRVMESTIYMESMKALGASPTPMAFSELYTALQNGTVSGQDNGPALTYTAKLFEVQDYYTVSEYCYAASMTAVSLDWWNTLPADVQEVLAGAGKAFGDAERQYIQDQTADYLKKLEEEGMEIIYLDADQKQEFRDATAPVYDIMKQYVSEDIIEMAKTVNDTYKQ